MAFNRLASLSAVYDFNLMTGIHFFVDGVFGQNGRLIVNHTLTSTKLGGEKGFVVYFLEAPLLAWTT